MFNTATWIDYPLAFVTAGILSFLGSMLAQVIGFFVLILAPFVGIVVAEGVRLVTRKRRSRSLYITALVGTILGCLPNIIIPVIYTLLTVFIDAGYSGFSGLLSILWDVLYAVLVATSMYYRLSGIQLGRK